MRLSVLSAVLAVPFLVPAPAAAQTLALLTGETTVVLVDLQNYTRGPSRVMRIGEDPLLGIDVRPADGRLYALASDGTIYTLNTASGRIAVKASLDTELPQDVTFATDFNPMADRLRVIASDGTNLRVNVDDGKVTIDGGLRFSEDQIYTGETPNVVSVAYSNKRKGAKETALYDIDAARNVLLKQVKPNEGILVSVGRLGIPNMTGGGFDIVADEKGNNVGWLVTNSILYRVDVASGKAVMTYKLPGIDGQVRDMAVLVPR